MVLISVDQPSVALSTTGVSIRPRSVTTARTRESSCSIDVTVVWGWTLTAEPR